MRLGLFQAVLARRAALLVACAVFTCAGPAAAAELRIGGTGNATGSMALLAEAYVAANPGAGVTVLKSIGTSGALKAVAKNAIDIGLSSRPVTAAEANAGLTSIEYARCATVFTVRENSVTTAVSAAQVAKLLRGDTTTWPDGTPVRPVLRQPGDDNTRQVRQISAAIAAALAVADKRPGAIVASTDQEAAEKMEEIPGSFGVSTIALIRSEKRRLQALAFDDIEPTTENVQSGRYPLVKRFFFIVQKNPSPASAAFIRFATSEGGRRVLRQTGHTEP